MSRTAMIGTVLQDFTVEVEKGRLRLFAKAIGETNPIFFDEAAAQAAGYPSIVSPPTFIYCLSEDVPDPNKAMTVLGLDPTKALHATQKIRHLRPVCAGERLRGKTILKDYFEKKGGALKFVISETVFLDAENRPVASLETTVVENTEGDSR